MKRAAALAPLPPHISRRMHARGEPLWRQLSLLLRGAIASGRLAAKERLPSSRTLAKQLNISRNTVLWAYDDLTSRGLIRGRVGAGSCVADCVRPLPALGVDFEDDSGNRLSLGPLPSAVNVRM